MSVIDDINKRRTRQNPGGNEPVAPSATVTPQTVQRRPSEDVASQPQVVQPQVQEPVNRPVGDQAAARVAQGAMPQVESGFNPTAEQKATAMALMNPAAPGYTIPQQAVAPTVEPVTTYTDIAKRINPELDAEAKAKREKQLRTKKQVAAIGDAINALANMHYTGTSGVNAYDPSATLSGKAKEGYDKFLADVKSYEDAHKAAMLRGAELNAAATEARRKEAVAEKRADKAAADAAEARRLAQENWQATFDYNKEKDAADRQERAKARAQENAFKQQQQKALEEYRKDLVESKSTTNAVRQINKLYGKPIAFARPNDTNLEIYESVWKGSMPQVYAILASETAKKFDLPGHGIKPPTWNEMDAYVKKNWLNSERAKDLMSQLAGDTPARLISGIAENNSLGWGEDNSNNDELDW